MKKPIDKCSVCGSSCEIESCQPSKLIQKLINSVRRECGGCGAEFVSDESLNQHIKTDCPLSFIPCKFAPFGCDESITRKQYDSHMQSSMEKHLALLADCIAEKKAKGQEEDEEEDEKVGESRSEKKCRQEKQKCKKRVFLVMAGVISVVMGVNLVRALSCKQLVLLGVLAFLLVHLFCFFFSRIFRRSCRSSSSSSAQGIFPSCPFKSKHKKSKKNKKKDQKKHNHQHHNPSPSPSPSPPLDG